MDMFQIGEDLTQMNYFKQEMRVLFSDVRNAHLKDAAACFGVMQNGMTEDRRNELVNFFNEKWNQDVEGMENKGDVLRIYYEYTEHYDFRMAIDKEPKECGAIWQPIDAF